MQLTHYFRGFPLPLPPAQSRTLQHTRQVTFTGYRRDDGLWDVEGELSDTKTQAFIIPDERTWQPGEPVHHMLIRLTVDTALVVKDISVAMDSFPHGACPQAMAPVQRLVGSTLGRGWRKAIEHHLGGVQGCAHLRELLFNMATAAMQAVSGSFAATSDDQPPPHLGKCLAWDFDGPLVERIHPVFFQWQAKKT